MGMTETKIVGITDEQTACDECGRIELRSTVILAQDGAEIGRYGSSCAGKVLTRENGGPARTGASVLSAARLIEDVRRCRARDALSRAMRLAKAGEWGKANWARAEGGQSIGYTRPDEVAMNALILAKFKAHKATGAPW